MTVAEAVKILSEIAEKSPKLEIDIEVCGRSGPVKSISVETFYRGTNQFVKITDGYHEDFPRKDKETVRTF